MRAPRRAPELRQLPPGQAAAAPLHRRRRLATAPLVCSFCRACAAPAALRRRSRRCCFKSPCMPAGTTPLWPAPSASSRWVGGWVRMVCGTWKSTGQLCLHLSASLRLGHTCGVAGTALLLCWPAAVALQYVALQLVHSGPECLTARNACCAAGPQCVAGSGATRGIAAAAAGCGWVEPGCTQGA